VQPSAAILIVDDHDGFRTFARGTLEPARFTVADAATGAEAADAARTIRPGPVLLDIRLPDSDGFEVASPAAGFLPVHAVGEKRTYGCNRARRPGPTASGDANPSICPIGQIERVKPNRSVIAEFSHSLDQARLRRRGPGVSAAAWPWEARAAHAGPQPEDADQIASAHTAR
jgi:hypothetical protein